MTVIEADGVSTQPVVVDSLVIYAAQRYSVVVKMDQAVDNYCSFFHLSPCMSSYAWVPPGIRVNPSAGNTGFDGGINSAILRYDGAAVADPTSTQTTSVIPLNEVDLHVSHSVIEFGD